MTCRRRDALGDSSDADIHVTLLSGCRQPRRVEAAGGWEVSGVQKVREEAVRPADANEAGGREDGWLRRLRRPRKGRWWEKYLPFVARSPEKQVEWLLTAFRRQTLSAEEIRPYVSLLLEDDHPEAREELRQLLAPIGSVMWCRLLAAADITDLPTLIGLMPDLGVEEAKIALQAVPPPYVTAPEPLLDAVHDALHHKNAAVYDQAVQQLLTADEAPPHLPAAHARFTEILRDRELLSTLFPRARS